MKNYFSKIKFLISLTFSFLFFISFSSAALAADTIPTGDLRLTTSPLPINLKVQPGATATAQLKIKNDGIATEQIKVSLMKFKSDQISGAPLLSEREQGDDFFDWVTFSQDKFELPSNEWKTITATFTVPETAAFGYYYAIVFSRQQENVPTADRQTVIAGGTATLVLLEVQVPNAKKEIQVVDFSVNKSMFEFLPAVFTIKLRNTGSVHAAPRGNIFISKAGQKDAAILEVNPTKGSILPNSPRSFQETWSDAFPYYVDKQQDGKTMFDEKNNPIQELKWNFGEVSKLRWGKYTAKLLLIYDDGKRDIPVESEVSFWVIPWRLIAYSIAIPSVPALLVYFFMKWRMKKNLEKKKIVKKRSKK
ncbi:MAG: hypothetical protein WCI36_04480 [bacterium]